MAVLNNITIYRGESVALQFTMTPVTDITGWTIALTVRHKPTDAGSLITIAAATLLTPATGVFQFTLTHAQTVALLGNYAYDVQRTDGGSEAVLSIGTFTVSQEVLYP